MLTLFMEPKRMNLFRCDVFRHFHKDAGQTRSIKGDLNMRRIAKAFTILAAICAICSSTQISQAQQQNLASSNLPNFGLNGPGWAEVLSVTPKWVVLQAADGRQYPVSASALGRFIVRWPILPTMVSATAVVEAEGQSPSVNTVLTNYVEVYEGAARSFVSQTYITPTDAGILRQYDATYTCKRTSLSHDKDRSRIDRSTSPRRPRLRSSSRRQHQRHGALGDDRLQEGLSGRHP